MTDHKKAVLSKIDIPELCKELVPSLHTTGRNRQATGLCPFHTDKNPSLSVNIETGAFFCHSCGKSGKGVIDLLMEVRQVSFNVAMQELERRAGIARKQRKQEVTGRYEFYTADGVLCYVKERLEPGRNGRKKEFRILHGSRRRSGRGYGVEPILYNLPRVIDAEMVIMLEGEKHADLINAWGLVGTSLDCGCESKLTRTMIEQLAGKDIVILPDNDEPGRKYADYLARSLRNKARSLKVIILPGLRQRGDIIDWAQEPGNAQERLLALITSAPEWEPGKITEDAGTPPPEPPPAPLPVQSTSLRAFPRLYLDLDNLLHDPRRYHFGTGEGPIFDAICLRLGRAPGARLPNVPEAIGRGIGAETTTVEAAINTAVRCGLLLLHDDNHLSNTVITEAHTKATEVCIKNAESGAKGGKQTKRKRKK